MKEDIESETIIRLPPLEDKRNKLVEEVFMEVYSEDLPSIRCELVFVIHRGVHLYNHLYDPYDLCDAMEEFHGVTELGFEEDRQWCQEEEEDVVWDDEEVKRDFIRILRVDQRNLL